MELLTPLLCCLNRETYRSRKFAPKQRVDDGSILLDCCAWRSQQKGPCPSAFGAVGKPQSTPHVLLAAAVLDRVAKPPSNSSPAGTWRSTTRKSSCLRFRRRSLLQLVSDVSLTEQMEDIPSLRAVSCHMDPNGPVHPDPDNLAMESAGRDCNSGPGPSVQREKR